MPEHWDPTDRQAGVAIADAALARLGAPYRYGGTTGGGYDCSGLVYRIYLEHGIQLPRTVREQAQVGQDVRSLVPGDLLFFRLSGGSASHVGIYVGDGGFVHASTGRRQVVRDDLRTNEYFRERYLGARRILPLDDAD